MKKISKIVRLMFNRARIVTERKIARVYIRISGFDPGIGVLGPLPLEPDEDPQPTVL